jgi:transcriptional regulator with PAS, ATPase and Fis domain
MRTGGDNLILSSATGLPLEEHGTEPALVGASQLFKQVLSVVDAVSGNGCVVLLEGESGTGKELLARRIHAMSSRSSGPFIPVNCPGISESLFESQFYGHIRGSFTGAMTDTLGVVRAAQDGTLFLDEVGELPLHLQPKLLRLLQEHEVTPVGASRPIPANARFVAATNRPLARSVAEGLFRGDLYHRLNIVRIEIPPLRNRVEDIEPLVDYYLAYYGQVYGLPQRQLGERLRQQLRAYPWPGNVRELSAYVERLYAANLPPMPPGSQIADLLYQPTRHVIEPPADRMPIEDLTPVCLSLAQSEAKAIRSALEMASFNRTEAARILRIHRSTLLRKMRLYGLGEA